MRRYFYLLIAIVSGLALTSCNKFEKDATITGKVGYVVALVDTVQNETTYVYKKAVGAKVFLMGDDGAPNPYTGPVLDTVTDSTGSYTFVVDAITEPNSQMIPNVNFGIKIQVFYFDSIIGPAYGELSGYQFTPGRDVELPIIFLNRQAQ